jgi:hypothetical protein
MPQLHLTNMHATRDGSFTLYTAPVADRGGESRYELTVHGSRKLVESVLGKSGLDIDIDAKATQEDAAKRAQQLLAPYYERLDSAMREPWRIAAPRASTSKRAAPTPARTITVSLRRTSGKGTLWVIATPLPIAWLPGTMVQFVLPNCFTGGATALPVSGNPNVVIRFNAPFAPIAAASALGGLAVDTAGFTNPPWLHVYPFNQFPAAGATPAVAIVACWGFGLLPF